MGNMNTEKMLEHLIGFDTTSRHSNLALIDFVAQWLEDCGVASQRIPDDTGKKANLVATIGPADIPGLVLSGHTDVVPIDGQQWDTDPFKAHIADGRMSGRGTADMKGFIASVLSSVPAMQKARLQRPFVLALSYDEEVGCVGVRKLLAQMANWEVKPMGCIVGEPTSMKVVIGHKGKRSLRVIVTGTAAHSSLAPTAVNAAEYGARLTVFIQDLGRQLAREGRRDELYDIAHTTAHVGVLRGGQMLNIVPEECRLDFEFRALPEDDIDRLVQEVKDYATNELLPAMKSVSADANIEFTDISGFPGLSTQPTNGFVSMVRELANSESLTKVAYGTEAGLFTQTVGIPAVVCGPGSIEQAHKPNEWIAQQQLLQADQFLARLIAASSTA
tara:strand:+ start:2375 stop:3538 length:1164 start_codon:yes stop_codon:yes gene_type:complete